MTNTMTSMGDKRIRTLLRMYAVAAGILILLSAALFGSQQSEPTSGQTAASNISGTTATLPAGTRMMVKMVDSVDSERSKANDRFRGSLDANLMSGDVVVAPKGTPVFGRLLTAESAGRSGGQLEFDLTDIVINNQTYSLTTSSNQVQGQTTTSGGAATGAKAGAAVGALAGGVGGAVRGAGTGAVAGKASGGSTTGDKVNLPAGTLVEFTLKNPVSLPIANR